MSTQISFGDFPTYTLNQQVAYPFVFKEQFSSFECDVVNFTSGIKRKQEFRIIDCRGKLESFFELASIHLFNCLMNLLKQLFGISEHLEFFVLNFLVGVLEMKVG